MPARLNDIRRVYVGELRARVDAEVRPGPEADRQMAIVILTVIGCLIFMAYFGSSGRIENWERLLSAFGLDGWGAWLRETLHSGEHRRMAQKVFWAVTRLVGYVFIPAVVVLVAFRGEHRLDLRELFGFRIRGFVSAAPAYLLMLAIIIPLVVLVSYSESFQNKYPFYRLAPDEGLWPWLIAWELLYAAQFIALEIFYRGFMVHGLKLRMGWASVFVMMIPYMMIHFGKPLPECVGSIIAGFALGTMSLKSGSIWWGAILHVAVAWTMDALCLWHAGHI